MTAAAELMAAINAYSVRGALALLGVRVSADGAIRTDTVNGARVRVTVSVPDTAGPGTVEIARCAVVDLARWYSDGPDAVDWAVWTALLDVLSHEAGECLLRDGALVFDPHHLPRVGPWV